MAETPTTTTLLLATLRDATGRADLEYLSPPTPLTGGFYAEMLRFRLADPPADLDRDLVARIVPQAPAGAWEATIQRHVADQGFPTPAVRLTAPDSSPLGRFLIVMDHVDGRPPMEGLTPASVLTSIPSLVRHLPDQLAGIAARLHALDPEPLAVELESLDGPIPPDTVGFVELQVAQSRSLDRTDLASVGERLLATLPPSDARVIAHGDLHPFNLLVTSGDTQLIDWSLGRVAHPGFTLGFADLILANPPIPLPRVGATVLGPLARSIARRFLSTYRVLTRGTRAAVDDEQLAWHRDLHALRVLVELASWDAAGTRPTSGHPWLVLEPVACRLLGVDAPPR
jgi:aminoglycoside phosphotransferase (APT) family kinase protein